MCCKIHENWILDIGELNTIFKKFKLKELKLNNSSFSKMRENNSLISK
jgi:hypothetical protein